MNNLVDQMKKVKSGRRSLRREYSLKERAEVVLAWLNGEITYGQFSKVIGPKSKVVTSRVICFIAYTVRDMYKNKMIIVDEKKISEFLGDIVEENK